MMKKSKKVKSICNALVLILGICTTLRLLKLSDLPNIFNLAFMEKPMNISDIELSILTSFFVTSVFYLFMNYIPDKIEEMEKEERMFPYRCAMHRDIQLFITNLLGFWSNAYKCAEEKDATIKTKEIDSISKMFEKNNILKVAELVKFSEKSRTVTGKGTYVSWSVETQQRMSMLIECGEKILENYSKDLPPEIYEAVHCLIGESVLLKLIAHARDIVTQIKSGNASLLDCMLAHQELEENIVKSAEYIETIYNWANAEYTMLEKKGDIQKHNHKVDLLKLLNN